MFIDYLETNREFLPVLLRKGEYIRVADPHSFDPYSDPYLNTDPDPVQLRIQFGSRVLTFDDQKLQKIWNWKKFFKN